MGFFIRKTIKFGPIRVNLSKSGVGYSIGVTGARIGRRPNGSTYIHAGRYGLYYREELTPAQKNNIQGTVPVEKIKEVTNKYLKIDAAQLVKSSKNDLIKKLNKSYKSLRVDITVLTIGAIISFLLFYNEQFYIAGALFSLSLVSFIYLYKWEKQRRTVNLEYDLEERDATKYTKILSAINCLASCGKVWVLLNESYTDQWKHHAGATTLVNRELIKIGEGTPPWVNANISIGVISCRGQNYYFLPDGILVYDSTGVGHIDYSDVVLDTRTGIFVENGSVSSDSNIIGYTWEHPNKRGGPDRRFASNRQLPECMYGYLDIKFKQGLQLSLLTSKEDAPMNFQNEFLVGR